MVVCVCICMHVCWCVGIHAPGNTKQPMDELAGGSSLPDWTGDDAREEGLASSTLFLAGHSLSWESKSAKGCVLSFEKGLQDFSRDKQLLVHVTGR